MGIRRHSAATKKKIARALLTKNRKKKIRNKRIRKKIKTAGLTVGNELVRAAVVGGSLGATKLAVESSLEGDPGAVFTKKGVKALTTGAALGTATYGVSNVVGSVYDMQSNRLRSSIDKDFRKKRRRLS